MNPNPILYDKDDTTRNLRKLHESVPSLGRRIMEDGTVVNIADVIVSMAAEQVAIANDTASVLSILTGQTLVDQRQERAGDFVYFGFAKVLGSLTSAAVWQIVRVDEAAWSASGILVLRFADGVSTYTKEWDDKATYNYAA